MRLGQTLRQTPTVSPQLVMANELLQFSSLELEQAIARELAENPALELREAQQCPSCGAETRDGACPSCGLVEAETREPRDEQPDDYPLSDYGLSEVEADEEWESPIARLASKTTLADYLLHQARLNLPAAEVPIALYLVESLDDRGFLRCDLDDVASTLSVQREHVDRVLATVQLLDPIGIAARDARECLLIQLEHLHSEGVEQAVAQLLIREHWEILGRCSFSRVASEAKVSVDEVRESLRFIRENLNPFPAHVFWSSRRDSLSSSEATCLQPDVIIRESRSPGGDYKIELPQARGARLRVSDSYRQALEGVGAGNGRSDQQEWEGWETYRARAWLFVRSIEQRWQTLYELMRCLVAYQRDFVAHGEKHLRPLTRARVAKMMDVHESTVCRAVAGKYALLPSCRVVPLAKFFDSAAPIKQMIEDLVDRETQPLSDRAIAERLRGQGHNVARRTVAKYRNALEILPSSLRGRSKAL
ncbi:MAG: RNA polymerase factor sigma-54 [Anaerolineae bacterium]|jgi:RNA polymerase sigma-54 factor